MLPSTRAFFKEWRARPDHSLADQLHGYIYARWPYLYISLGTGEHRLAKIYTALCSLLPRIVSQPATSAYQAGKPTLHGADLASDTFADGYHGKVVPLGAATQLVSVNEPVRLTDLEKIIPYVRARDIILQNPDHIIALDCPCRVSREHPCLPLDVCLIIGEPFASLVAEHHPGHSRWITSQEAADILKAEDERGHVHHAFFKDAMLGRFYAICNCCSCCCGAMQAQRRGTPMLASSGYVSTIDDILCIGCGDCAEICQFGAIKVNGQAQVNAELCMGCGICLSHCDQGAVSLMRDPSKGDPLEIYRLMEQIALS